MALMCQGAISQLRSGAMAAKLGFLKFWGFRRAFRNYEMRLRATNGTRVPRGGFTAAKIFTEGVHGVAKSFRSQGPFSQGPLLGCEISHTMVFLLLISFF